MKEPGQMAFEKSRPNWLWCEISVSERKIWAAVESAIRADEAAKAAGAIYKATETLRKCAEREKEMVEALEAIAFARNDRVGPGLSECISIARAILSKHKGQT
jgi:hypothetical protein